MQSPNRTELIALVEQIRQTAACRTDMDGMLKELERKTGDPEIGVMIFCPPGGSEMTAEQIVDQALERRSK